MCFLIEVLLKLILNTNAVHLQTDKNVYYSVFMPFCLASDKYSCS